MTLPNPKFAPRRNDLPWLRRRRRPPVVEASTTPASASRAAPARAASTPAAVGPTATGPARGAAAAGPPHSGGKIDYTRRDRTRPAAATPPTPAPDVTPRRAPDATPRRAPDVTPRRAPDVTRRDRPAAAAAGNPLDLSGPTPTRAAPLRRDPAPATGGNPLDLSGPVPRRDPAPTSGGDPLDLSGPAPAGGGDPLDLSAPTPGPAPTAAGGGSTSLDLGGTPRSRPAPAATGGGSTSLDLGGPPSSAPAATGGGSTSLDLGGGATPPSPPRPSSTSLDLGGAPAGTGGAGSGRVPRPAPTPARHHVARRTRHGAATLLEFTAPVVTLTRVQSGVGALTFDAVVGDEVGDLRIGAAWALTDGRTGTVELDAGRKLGPDGRHAVVWAGREGRFERISVDLRQSRSLARLLLYGFSPSRQTVPWGGTIVTTTFGGNRVDAPIVSAPSPAVLALLSVYQVDGEFVVRSEMDPVAGTVRDTCRAFGYDRITWLDDRTPVA